MLYKVSNHLIDKSFENFFEVYYLIVKDKKPHSLAETPTFPAAIKMTEIIA